MGWLDTFFFSSPFDVQKTVNRVDCAAEGGVDELGRDLGRTCCALSPCLCSKREGHLGRRITDGGGGGEMERHKSEKWVG